jgi:hypothetical protein
MSASSVNLFSGESNWLATTLTNIKNSENPAGIMGALQNMSDGSVSSFLSTSKSAANALATISQSNVTNSSNFYVQLANQALQDRMQKQQEQALKELQRTQNEVQPTNVLDSYIYFEDGSSIDTENNILTMSDGTQIDTVTGAEMFDSASIIQMANGAYLDTKNNILTMSDGTQIDTVTGIKISDLEALEDG